MAEEQLAVAPARFEGGAVAVPPPDFAAVDRTNKRDSDFTGLTERIKNIGGIAAPEQRLQVAKSLAEVQPETSVLKAIGQSLLGNPNARLIASQGRIKPTTVYDLNGDPIYATFAENSDIPLEAIDVKTKQPLTYDQWVERKGGQFANYKETFGAEAKKIEVQKRATYNEEENAITNLQDAAAAPLKDLYGKQREAYSKLGSLTGLSNEELNQLSSMSTGTATYSQSLSDAYNTMKQAQKDKSTKDALQKSGKLSWAAGVLAASGGITKDKVQNAGSSELDQLYKNASSGQGLETGYNQTQKQAFESAWYRRLDPAGKKLVEDIFQRSKNIDQLTAQASKLGDLNIAPTPFNPEILKQAGSGELQSTLGEFKAEATSAFAAWRKAQQFAAGEMPAIGELQSAFTRTKIYKDLQAKYDGILDDVEARAQANLKKHSETGGETKATIGGIGVAPTSGAEINANKLKREVPPPAEKTEKKPSSEDRVKALVNELAKSLQPKK